MNSSSKDQSQNLMKQKIKLIERLVNLSIASAKIEKINIKQKKGVWSGLYPPISIYICAKYGSLKSTMLQALSDVTKQPILKKVTAAGLVGTITDDGGGMISPVWEHRNLVMAIDEFNAVGDSAAETKQALLDIIEKGVYSKVIGRKAKNKVDKSDGDLYYRIEEGQISFKTRCGAVICTMVKHQADTFHLALLSRCIPVTYEIDDPDMIFNGEVKFKFKKLKVKKEVDISLKDWNIITKAAKDYSGDDIVRTASMLARVYAVIGKHDDTLYQIICGLRNDTAATSIVW